MEAFDYARQTSQEDIARAATINTAMMALKSSQLRALVHGEGLQLGLFDERNLVELTHPDYPGERLVACRNPELGRARGHKRTALLAATREELERVRAMVEGGRLRGAGNCRERRPSA